MKVSGEDRLMLCKLDTAYVWYILNNPKIDLFTKALNTLLCNAPNDYAEYKNCGVQNRMIRIKDVEKYDIELSGLKEEWILKKECLDEDNGSKT